MRKFLNVVIRNYRIGLRNQLKNYFNNRVLWDLEKSFTMTPEGTSITDSDFAPDYGATCDLMARDPDYFKKFRRSRALISALDHVSIEQGFQYIREIEKSYGWSPSFKSAINSVDAVGNPGTYNFGVYGCFSPTLIRYLKVYLDLTRLFGDLRELKISEIGVGFGGQAGLMGRLGGYKAYNFFDLPPVLKLVEQFLSSTGSSQVNQFYDGRNPVAVESDLVVSNYAFSELAREIQISYLDTVILRAKRGYITWNNLSAVNLDGLSLTDLVRIIPNSEIMAEVPYTHDGNVILYWGENKIL